MTVKLKHPTFKDVEIEVEKDKVQEHLEQGWLKTSQRRKPEVHTALDVVAEDSNSPATDEN